MDYNRVKLQYKSLTKRDDEDNEQSTPMCDARSSLCYTNIPGKRLARPTRSFAKTAHAYKVLRRQNFGNRENSISVAQDVVTKEEQVNVDDEKKENENCNPKRNYLCRYRIPGKRSRVNILPFIPIFIPIFLFSIIFTSVNNGLVTPAT